jgi:serine/arginine repetitive matrix protein 2
LSYSPARRNPERYKEILDSKKPSEKQGRKQAGPVVKLHPTDSDHESSGNDVGAASKVDEYLFDKNQDKELNRLKALKSELAAKAKESLERKLISESTAGGSQRKIDTNPVIQQVAIARNEEAPLKSREEVKTVEKKPSRTRKSRSHSRSSRKR